MAGLRGLVSSGGRPREAGGLRVEQFPNVFDVRQGGAEITWRDQLPQVARVKLNHPDSIWRHYRARDVAASRVERGSPALLDVLNDPPRVLRLQAAHFNALADGVAADSECYFERLEHAAAHHQSPTRGASHVQPYAARSIFRPGPGRFTLSPAEPSLIGAITPSRGIASRQREVANSSIPVS